MSFDIGEILEKLKAIESFANKVAETKKLADQLAENFAKIKLEINEILNARFTDIANQIDTLRKNMEQMESVQPSGTSAAPTTPPAPAAQPAPTPQPAPQPAPAPTPAPAPAPEPVAAPQPTPEPAPAQPAAPEVETPPAAEAAPSTESDQLDFLIQQKERLKAQLTDLRFDYMRGYIPEEEYKAKEAELDAQLEELDKQIAALK